MKRTAGLLLVLVSLALGILAQSPGAEAQPFCAEGTLVGESCEIVGEPPIPWAYRCPISATVFSVGSFCYELVPAAAPGICGPGTIPDPGTSLCRSSVDLVSPGWASCPDTRFEIVGDRCIRYVLPQCGPNGCLGKITLAYTVDCLQAGTSRVTLGQPTVINGARISLITVNGSVTVGATLQPGQPVLVAVTPVRSGDEVIVTGPSVAPACGAAEPAPTPTVAPSPTPQPTSAPAPQPTARPTAAPTSVPAAGTLRIVDHEISECDGRDFFLTLQTAVEPSVATTGVQWDFGGELQPGPSPLGIQEFEFAGDGETWTLIAKAMTTSMGSDTLVVDFPTCTAEPAPTPTRLPTPSPVPAATEPPTAEPTETAPAPTATPAATASPASETDEQAAAVASSATDDGLPIVPLAAVGGATIVGSVAAYAALSSRPRGGRKNVDHF